MATFSREHIEDLIRATPTREQALRLFSNLKMLNHSKFTAEAKDLIISLIADRSKNHSLVLVKHRTDSV
jgi:hypothetical protein